MANTYTQIYIHIVFPVQGRQSLISPEHREELHKYITGIVTNRGQKLLAVNVPGNHAHIFIGMTPTICLSDLVRDIKAGSSGFINESGWIRGRFNWQEGFGAFSHCRSELDTVIRYVRNQEQHHRKRKFREEYVEMLNEFGVDFEERYLFLPVDDKDASQATPTGR
jgi:REP element-mobilizing transposase RayT